MSIESKEIAEAILKGNNFNYKEVKYISGGISRCSYDPSNPGNTIIYLNKNAYKDQYESAVVGAHEAGHALNNRSNPNHIKDLKEKHQAYLNSLLISVILCVIFSTGFGLLATKNNLIWMSGIFTLIFILKILWYTYAMKKYNKPYEEIYNKDEQDAEVTAEIELKNHVINNTLNFPHLTQVDKDKLADAMEKRLNYVKITKKKTREHFGIAAFELGIFLILITKILLARYL
ncbi:zinc metallopeptidase [Peribacillus sp. TH27]|uniref:zinc metallopeptidase n=1 Tax=Peribacillus sp. TH27 TaxID=2798484 RepID=UPI00191335C5|nr:zinc metallopeptidase [Peribacillus sp. TH27]MBK5458032.1 zinc metallopeptidase [Peribacillus sp. TH27]